MGSKEAHKIPHTQQSLSILHAGFLLMEIASEERIGVPTTATIVTRIREQGGRGRLIHDEKVETRAVEMAVYAFYFNAVGLVAVFSIFLLNLGFGVLAGVGFCLADRWWLR